MNEVLMLLPLLVVMVALIALLVTLVQIWTRHQHPLRLALQAVGGATLLGVLGVAGLLPGSLWWATWLFALAILVGLAVASRRALVRRRPTNPTPRRGRLLAPPSRGSVAAQGLGWLALVVIALAAG